MGVINRARTEALTNDLTIPLSYKSQKQDAHHLKLTKYFHIKIYFLTFQGMHVNLVQKMEPGG